VTLSNTAGQIIEQKRRNPVMKKEELLFTYSIVVIADDGATDVYRCIASGGRRQDACRKYTYYAN